MSDSSDDKNYPKPVPQSRLNDVDQEVFYQILQNTARTAEEVASLRKDFQQMREQEQRTLERIRSIETRVDRIDLVLAATLFIGSVGVAALINFIFQALPI